MNSLPVNFLLVKASKPKQTAATDPIQQWRNFQANVERLQPLPQNTRTLGDSGWLLPARDGLIWLAKLNDTALAFDVLLRVYFLEHEPEWVDLFEADAAG